MLGGLTLPARAASPPAVSPEPVELRWRAPADCPDTAQVQATLSEALGPAGDDLQVDVVVADTGEGTFHAEVLMRGPWGESSRSLRSPTCDTLAEAVTLLAVVSVQQAEADALVIPEPQPPPEPEPEPQPPTSAPSVPGDSASSTGARPVTAREAPDASTSTAAPRRAGGSRAADAEASGRGPSSWQGLARLAARAGAGVLPGVDLSAALAVGLSHRYWRVELWGAGWIPRDEVVAADAAVRMHLVTGGLRGCAVLRPRPWLGVLPCADLEAGAMRGQGRGDGLAVGRTSWQPWLAVAVTPALTLRVHPRFSVWAGGSLVVPLRRPGFTLQGQTGDTYRAPVISGRGALGVELRFP